MERGSATKDLVADEDLADLTLGEIHRRMQIAVQNREQLEHYLDDLHKELKRRAGISGD